MPIQQNLTNTNGRRRVMDRIVHQVVVGGNDTYIRADIGVVPDNDAIAGFYVVSGRIAGVNVDSPGDC
jgi:hypothetical protein